MRGVYLMRPALFLSFIISPRIDFFIVCICLQGIFCTVDLQCLHYLKNVTQIFKSLTVSLKYSSHMDHFHGSLLNFLTKRTKNGGQILSLAKQKTLRHFLPVNHKQEAENVVANCLIASKFSFN